MPSKRLFMNKLNFDQIKTPYSFIIQDLFYIFQVLKNIFKYYPNINIYIKKLNQKFDYCIINM